MPFDHEKHAGDAQLPPRLPPKKYRYTTKRIVICCVVITSVIALAVGLGVGLTSRKKSPEHPDSIKPLMESTATGSSIRASLWQPSVGTTWQIVLSDPIKLGSAAKTTKPNVAVFDIDLFGNSKATIDTLHGLGKKVICYFSAGSYEPDHPDSTDFTDADLGSTLDGWPQEKWVDIRSANVRKIMAARVALACQKGCDGIDPDNVDGYSNVNGLGLTQDNAVDFVKFLAAEAATCNIAIGLKNAGDLVPALVSTVQFSVNEQCVTYKECTSFAPMINANKPVFHIEYPKKSGPKVSSGAANKICSATGAAAGSGSFSNVLKNSNLDGWVQYCDGSTAVTPVSA